MAFGPFFGLPRALLCLRAKATQQQHSCLVMEPWRPHKASSPAQVIREIFLGLGSQLTHQTTKSVPGCERGRVRALHTIRSLLGCGFQALALWHCWAVVFRLLPEKRASNDATKEHRPHCDQHGEGVGTKAQVSFSPSQAALCHSSCNVTDQARQDLPILLLP